MRLKNSIVTAASAVAVLGAFWIAAAPAQAAHLTPEYQYTFAGSGDHEIGEAKSTAVDEQTHDVYVADRANHRIEKFDSQGNFLLMFGDGVDETTGGNVCPEQPGDVCRPGQESSPSYPHFDDPLSLAVDNSTSSSKGDVYVAESIYGPGDGSVWKLDSTGHVVTSWGANGRLAPEVFRGYGAVSMTVSAFTGYLWVLDNNWQFQAFDDHGTESLTTEEVPNHIYEGQIGIDSANDLFFEGNGRVLKVDLTLLKESRQTLGFVYPGPDTGVAVDPSNSDMYVDSGEEVQAFPQTCEPRLGYCTPKYVFGSGHIVGGEGLSVEGETGAVYVATDEGVAYFKPKIVPDVLPNGPPLAGHTDAEVFAHLDPVGGGPITGCKVEYGPSTSYGSTIPCDQSAQLPSSGPIDVTATIPNLTAEATYHYRFVAENENGPSYGTDEAVTPHWVKDILTGEATEIGPGSAVLHGSFDPNGEDTHYTFEWGTTKAYGHKAPFEPEGEISSGSGDMPVEVSLAGQLTSETTYHYRIVAHNPLGTSAGVDETFTTPIAELPVIENPSASHLTLTSAELGGEVNPGFGDTSFMVQYGADTSYGSHTVISQSIGDDGVFHSVSADVTELSPGTTYHYRIVAFNFKGTVRGPDATVTTPDAPTIKGASAAVLGPTSVRLSAEVFSNGSSGGTTVHFDYGPGASYGSRTAESGPTGTLGGSESLEISGLAPGTTYHFRAVATNAFGSAVGLDQTFVTPPEASTPPPPRTVCRRNQVLRKGRCVKRHRKHHRKHRRKARG